MKCWSSASARATTLSWPAALAGRAPANRWPLASGTSMSGMISALPIASQGNSLATGRRSTRQSWPRRGGSSKPVIDRLKRPAALDAACRGIAGSGQVDVQDRHREIVVAVVLVLEDD